MQDSKFLYSTKLLNSIDQLRAAKVSSIVKCLHNLNFTLEYLFFHSIILPLHSLMLFYFLFYFFSIYFTCFNPFFPFLCPKKGLLSQMDIANFIAFFVISDFLFSLSIIVRFLLSFSYFHSKFILFSLLVFQFSPFPCQIKAEYFDLAIKSNVVLIVVGLLYKIAN